MPDYALLQQELSADPLGRGYADMTDAQAVHDLNTRYRTQPVPTIVTTRVLLARLEPVMAVAILDALTQASATDSTVRWAMDAFNSGGLDLGHPHTRASIDALVTKGTLSAEQAALLKTVGERPVSRAVEIWGWGVSEYDVAKARAL